MRGQSCPNHGMGLRIYSIQYHLGLRTCKIALVYITLVIYSKLNMNKHPSTHNLFIFSQSMIDIIYVNLPLEDLSYIQSTHEITKGNQFLMKLKFDYKGTMSNLMNQDLVPSLDA